VVGAERLRVLRPRNAVGVSPLDTASQPARGDPARRLQVFQRYDTTARRGSASLSICSYYRPAARAPHGAMFITVGWTRRTRAGSAGLRLL